MLQTTTVTVERHDGGEARRVPDEVIVEEPLEIRLDGTRVATTMRTPGDDLDLAIGFLHAEGLLDGAEVEGLEFGGGRSVEGSLSGSNAVDVFTDRRGPPVAPRLGQIGSACGICGADQILELVDRLRALSDQSPLERSTLDAALAAVPGAQDLHLRTGGVHAAALVDRWGSVIAVREDIGRHNAVDKVVGSVLRSESALDPRRLASMGLFVTSRASFEMVQKTWAAGIGTLIAAGAPSALAIETAQIAGLNLVAFARTGGFNVYSGSVAE